MKTIEELINLYNELRQCMGIDLYDIETVVERQASLYNRTGEGYADAAELRDYLEDRYKNVEAEVALEEKQRKEKITEQHIKYLIQDSPRRKLVYQQYLEAARVANKFYSLTKAYDHRREMIRTKIFLMTKSDELLIKDNEYTTNKEKLRKETKE